MPQSSKLIMPTGLRAALGCLPPHFSLLKEPEATSCAVRLIQISTPLPVSELIVFESSIVVVISIFGACGISEFEEIESNDQWPF